MISEELSFAFLAMHARASAPQSASPCPTPALHVSKRHKKAGEKLTPAGPSVVVVH
jgi:hypothetical protein